MAERPAWVALILSVDFSASFVIVVAAHADANLGFSRSWLDGVSRHGYTYRSQGIYRCHLTWLVRHSMMSTTGENRVRCLQAGVRAMPCDLMHSKRFRFYHISTCFFVLPCFFSPNFEVFCFETSQSLGPRLFTPGVVCSCSIRVLPSCQRCVSSHLSFVVYSISISTSISISISSVLYSLPCDLFQLHRTSYFLPFLASSFLYFFLSVFLFISVSLFLCRS